MSELSDSNKTRKHALLGARRDPCAALALLDDGLVRARVCGVWVSIAFLLAACATGCDRGRDDGGRRTVRIEVELPDGASAAKLRRLGDDEVTPELSQKAQDLLREHADSPLGTEIPFEFAASRYVARVEQHDDPRRGPHKGITMYAREK